MSKIDEAIAIISAQQNALKVKNNTFYIAEQLKDICRKSEANSALVCEDLNNTDKSITALANKIKERAYKNRVGNESFVSMEEADEIIRNFFGLGADDEAPQPPQSAGTVLDLADFLK